MLTLSKLVWDWGRGHAFTRIYRMMSASFTGIIDLQALLGVALLLGSWSNTLSSSPDLIYHPIIMITSVLEAHMASSFPACVRYHMFPQYHTDTLHCSPLNSRRDQYITSDLASPVSIKDSRSPPHSSPYIVTHRSIGHKDFIVNTT